MYIRTLIQAIKEIEIEIELIVKQLNILHSVCELAINSAFAQAPEQFDANGSSAVILLHWWQRWDRRSKSSRNPKFGDKATMISEFGNPWS